MAKLPSTPKQAIEMARTVGGMFALADSHIDVPIQKRHAKMIWNDHQDELMVQYYQSDRFCRL